MRVRMTLTGIDKVMGNLNSEIKKMERKITQKGLVRAIIIARRDMDKRYPKIPIRYGNLRASWFIITPSGAVQQGNAPSFKGPAKLVAELQKNHLIVLAEAKSIVAASSIPVVAFGFSANYAAFVHEMPKELNWSRPESGPKYLESSLNRNSEEMLYTIAKESKP